MAVTDAAKTAVGLILTALVVYVGWRVYKAVKGVSDAVTGAVKTAQDAAGQWAAAPGRAVDGVKAMFNPPDWDAGRTTPASLSKPGSEKIQNVRTMNPGCANRDVASMLATFSVHAQPTGSTVPLTQAACWQWWLSQGGTAVGIQRLRDAIFTAAKEKGCNMATASSDTYWAAVRFLKSGNFSALRYETAKAMLGALWFAAFGVAPTISNTSRFE